ncbi:hypothetical protein [Streptomyces sp. S1D4-20]|uniref:hypothetical protein n=1 Tax=Streptomyces sp. S1D4-20 TaxID=2594462 RepID=UPI001163FC1D|nr:hypothetical protein [Streptomyces sp. S1D4-20]QDN54062.1 hypothetical protein FNV67_00335 [Streptomyces sp. S1D4-20]
MPTPDDTPAIQLPAAAYEGASADVTLAQPEREREHRATAEPAMESSAALRVARSLAATLAAARERVSDIQPPKLARAALESLTAIHADLTAPDYDPREGTHLVLLLAFEDTCEQYGVITPAERTTCATHRAHAADCCVVPLSAFDPFAPALVAAVEEFTGKWRSAATAEAAAPALSCPEIDALAALLRAAGAPDAADQWTAAHTATDAECEGHATPETGPVPSSGHFTLPDLVRATAKLLGPGWKSGPRRWGTCGALTGPYETSFLFCVDDQSDLLIEYRRDVADSFPDSPDLPDGVEELQFDEGVWLEEAAPEDGLKALAVRCAAAIRAITNYDPDDWDFESSASRQYYVDTGRYLRKGEAEAA